MKQGFDPIAGAATRVFILGSLPGERSLAEQRYYANPANQFWRLVAGAAGEDWSALDHPARLARLDSLGIGLWDVYAAAHRAGSSDGAIRGALVNPLGQLVRAYPALAAIAFNGAAAARAGRRALGADCPLALYDLPSSSAANTAPLAAKQAAWSVLAKHLRRP